MIADNKRVIQRFFEDVFNAQSRAAAQELIAPTFAAHHPAFPDGIRGPEGIIQTVAFFRSAFPDLNYLFVALRSGPRVRWAGTRTCKREI